MLFRSQYTALPQSADESFPRRYKPEDRDPPLVAGREGTFSLATVKSGVRVVSQDLLVGCAVAGRSPRKPARRRPVSRKLRFTR